LEKYGSMAAFEEALEERRILDERAGKKSGNKPARSERPSTETRYSFYDSSGPPSRGSFRKPGESQTGSTNVMGDKAAPPINRRLDSLRTISGPPTPGQPNRPSQSTSNPHTPIPTVMTPQLASTPPVDLNKLQAKVLRARLVGAPNADELEREYEEAKQKSQGIFSADGKKLQVLPTIDGQGRLYDVGTGKSDDATKYQPGNKRKKEKVCQPLYSWFSY
jgi:hypothetical protein